MKRKSTRSAVGATARRAISSRSRRSAIRRRASVATCRRNTSMRRRISSSSSRSVNPAPPPCARTVSRARAIRVCGRSRSRVWWDDQPSDSKRTPVAAESVDRLDGQPAHESLVVAARAAVRRSRRSSRSAGPAPSGAPTPRGKYTSKTGSKTRRCPGLWSRVAASPSRSRSRSAKPSAARARAASTVSPVPIRTPCERSAPTSPVSRSAAPAVGTAAFTRRPDRAWPPPSVCRPGA